MLQKEPYNLVTLFLALREPNLVNKEATKEEGESLGGETVAAQIVHVQGAILKIVLHVRYALS